MRVMMFVLSAVTCLGLASSLACAKSEADPAAPTAAKVEAAPTQAADSDKFSVAIAPVELKAGATGSAKITFTPAKGFKWNLEYPAKLEFEAPADKVTLTKTKFNQLKGDFKASEKEASVAVPVTGKGAGQAELKGKVKVSVCNDTTCLIEKADVVVQVTVKP